MSEINCQQFFEKFRKYFKGGYPSANHQQRETVHDVQWTSALHGPERSGDIRMSESGRTQLSKRRISRDILLSNLKARDGARRPMDVGPARTGAKRRNSNARVRQDSFITKRRIPHDLLPSNPAARDGARRPVDVGSARTGAKRRNSNVRVRQDSFITKRTSIGCPFCYKESARRDSNPRPRPWQGRAPPTEPLAHKYLCAKYI